MQQLSAEYLSDCATLLKMTTFYETKLEEHRIKMALTPHFDPHAIFQHISHQGYIYPIQIKELFGQFMSNITDIEIEYIYQLYSSDPQKIQYTDFIQMIQPNQIQDYNSQSQLQHNQQIITDLLIQVHKFFRIEIQYFRQAEPMRMYLFEKHKENGKNFCLLLEDHKGIITQQSLTQFMKKQKFQFNSQDLFCLKKRLRINQEAIQVSDFIKNCPLLPFQVMLSRNPTYKLIEISQQPEQQQQQQLELPPVFREPDLYVSPLPETVQQFEKTNYEIFMGSDQKYQHQANKFNQPSFTQPNFNHYEIAEQTQEKTEVNFRQEQRSSHKQELPQAMNTTLLDKFMKNNDQTIINKKFGTQQQFMQSNFNSNLKEKSIVNQLLSPEAEAVPQQKVDYLEQFMGQDGLFKNSSKKKIFGNILQNDTSIKSLYKPQSQTNLQTQRPLQKSKSKQYVSQGSQSNFGLNDLSQQI